MEYFQCDLSGADGWTVAAHCKRLGDATMFDDYLYGIKPANVIALMYQFGKAVGDMPRADLKLAAKKVDKEGWLYFASKVIQHGTNYLMGPNLVSSVILKRSYKELGDAIFVSPTECKKLQSLYQEGRYKGIKLWHKDCETQLITKGRLKGASGHTRVFLGRRKSGGKVDHQTLGEFVADEPQENTTYATNLAMYNLSSDSDNRRPNGGYIIEPLHQVHDALNGQYPQRIRDWAHKKIKSYFENPMQIAGMTITIPYEGNCGPSWGELPYKLE